MFFFVKYFLQGKKRIYSINNKTQSNCRKADFRLGVGVGGVPESEKCDQENKHTEKIIKNLNNSLDI